jgi:protein-S-isoprenylcysteine O-methyltransferase Ste14
MFSFDPFGWASRFLPASLLHTLVRLTAILVLAGFLWLRLSEYNLYLFKPLWLVESLIFVVLIIAYAIREEPVGRSRTAPEILLPLLGSTIPFALLFTSPVQRVYENRLLLYGIFIWMTLATFLTVWGLWTLRRSFSITVEARSPVTGGPYRWLRHPVYLGEMGSAAAVTVWRFSALNVLFFLMFAGIQLYRTKMEEAKLLQFFPVYAEYRQNAWWFF